MSDLEIPSEQNNEQVDSRKFWAEIEESILKEGNNKGINPNYETYKCVNLLKQFNIKASNFKQYCLKYILNIS